MHATLIPAVHNLPPHGTRRAGVDDDQTSGSRRTRAVIGVRAGLEMMRQLSVNDVASRLSHAERVHGLYVEVTGEGNFRHLSALRSLCRYVKHVHVHFVHGSFSKALLHCRNIIAVLHDWETCTFTSELPSYKQPDPTALLHFVSCAAMCGNVTFRKPTGMWSCIRLRDLVLDCHEPVILPF
ncbi:hypothetical protein HPB51_008903 [Rhipicephalus microplus]|uniref:Uncharacterized protein n=1 Tax=Rhipicephalus microplus TaxID=6941 RepID=A0A9J6ESM2_RHIMP|nr:hypothetical protein HPB51_008903 [Rhipicephalus microplus]